MNKRILSVIVFGAALLSAQAQDGKGGISPAMLGQIQQSYQGTPSDKALRNAIGNNDIRKLALNQENMQDMDTHFSIKVDSKGITDQKSSGRCWLFTGLNVMRAKALARYGFPAFEFSEIYPFFWDQLEKSNLFLQGIIDTADKPLDDKTVEWLLKHPLSDGGTFTGVADIVSKYGLVPKSAMPERVRPSAPQPCCRRHQACRSGERENRHVGHCLSHAGAEPGCSAYGIRLCAYRCPRQSGGDGAPYPDVFP